MVDPRMMELEISFRRKDLMQLVH